tara:strand:- start:813 stop:1478 length:666 start_codon:yes stop_codon:yes gene_type:complete
MKLIPAIDLKNNKVVTAIKGGQRKYQEISSKLSPTSDPIKFIEYILSLSNFNTIYIADLDSIKEFKKNNKTIRKILQEYENISFIVDNGVRKFSQLNIYKNNNFKQIVATESFEDYEDIIEKNYCNYILSVDFTNNKILHKNEKYKYLKPKKVISMDIDNIGKKNGLDIKNISCVKEIYPQSDIIISGGIGCNEDIYRASQNGSKEIILLTAILEKNISLF